MAVSDRECRISNLFSIMFYYIFSTTYQKIGDLVCPVIFLHFRTVCLENLFSTTLTRLNEIISGLDTIISYVAPSFKIHIFYFYKLSHWIISFLKLILPRHFVKWSRGKLCRDVMKLQCVIINKSDDKKTVRSRVEDSAVDYWAVHIGGTKNNNKHFYTMIKWL